MKRYTVGHSVDDSGAWYCNGGPVDLETDDLDEAIAEAADLTKRGKCGYVKRDDEVLLNPITNGWLDPNGQELGA